MKSANYRNNLKKNGVRFNRRKCISRSTLYPFLFSSVFLGGAFSVEAGPAINDGTPDIINAGSSDLAISDTKTTWAGNAEDSGIYYNNVTLKDGSVWRPMDSSGTVVTGTLTLHEGSLLDLSYKYGENYPNNPWNGSLTGSTATTNNLTVGSANSGKTIFYNGATIRINMGNEDAGNGTMYDRITFCHPTIADGVDKAVVNLQVRYNKNFGGEAFRVANTQHLSGYAAVVSFTKIDKDTQTRMKNGDLTVVTDKTPYYIDSSLYKYKVTNNLVAGDVSSSRGGYQTYALYWDADLTKFESQRVFSANNAQLSMRNLWRIEDDLFWNRGEELRHGDLLSASDGSDGAWAQVWKGKYNFSGDIGSKFSQTYNGVQVGYDKKWDGQYRGGNVYTGVFFSLMNSDADFHQHSLSDDGNEVLYNSGTGDLKSKGLGFYAEWNRQDGQYIDFMARGSRLSNDYNFYDSDNDLYHGNYSTWAYGTGLRYGWHKEFHNGWFVEPQTGISYGVLKGVTYTANEDLQYRAGKMKTLVGHIGTAVGRVFGNGEHRSMIYAKALLNHDFKDGGNAWADALVYDGASKSYKVASSTAVGTLAGKDTWWKFTVGGDVKIGSSKNAFLELTKTTGGDVNTDWQVNAGLSWRFNGPSSKETVPIRGENRLHRANTGTGLSENVSNQTLKESGHPVPAGSDSYSTGSTSSVAANGTQQAHQQEFYSEGNETSDSGASVTGNGNGTYTIAPVTVEAARPQWEKELSPGTVSVVHVNNYKGEMKNLPDLLQTVPGVYVQRISGIGHYTVARIRGATGSEVNVYVDGVLINSASDSAVDLSVIPIENVDHIEVYRGYVPARFAGSPIGGAINIVTKKPTGTHGSISQGWRSFNGYTGNLEVTAPAGKGSILFGVNRDQSKGDFAYDHMLAGYFNFDGSPLIKRQHRMDNAYRNTDAIFKYQDEHWFAKLTWKDNMTQFPDSAYQWWADDPDHVSTDWRKRRQETKKTELNVGRRQTVGKLEWGWKVYTSYQNKEARASATKNTSGNYYLTVNNEFKNKVYGGTIDGSWRAAQNHLVEFMFNASHETMDVDQNGFHLWGTNNSVTGVSNYYKNYFKDHYNTNNYYMQIQDTMTLNRSGNLFFTPVLRAQKMTMNVNLADRDMGKWLYSYGLGLKKVQNEHWTFRGTYGTYYKIPNFYELFGDGVNVKSRWEEFKSGYNDFELDSMIERGTSWDVGADWTGKALGADTDLSLTYFNRHSKNLLSYSLDFYGTGYYSNLAAGKIQGLELENNMHWNRWDLMTAVTWNDSLVTKTGAAQSLVLPSMSQQGHPFPWVPKWEYNVRVGYRFPGDKLSLFAEYHYLDQVGFWYSLSKTLNESLGLTNIGAKYHFDQKWELTAGINDLFNKGPDQHYIYDSSTGVASVRHGVGSIYYPLQGRTYYMTMKYSF